MNLFICYVRSLARSKVPLKTVKKCPIWIPILPKTLVHSEHSRQSLLVFSFFLSNSYAEPGLSLLTQTSQLVHFSADSPYYKQLSL
jgi:hypothetical protein